MPTPPLPGGIAAQVVLASDTGFARDAVVNTFYFKMHSPTTPTSANLEYVKDTLISFYNDVHGTGSNQIRWYLSSTLDNGTDKALIKLYDMAQAHPRTPNVYPWTLGVSAGSDNGLPSEAALCLSYSSDFERSRSGRGRVYIGPLHSNTVLIEPPHIHVNPATILAMQRGASFLRDAETGIEAGCTWSVYSRKLNELNPVTDAYIDNEFDTQRRRGHRATVRSFMS